jgi:hypothetical protein
MANLENIKNSNELFKTPEGYFDNLANDIQLKISEEKLKEKFGNGNPFAVPNGYFENIVAERFILKKLTVFQMFKPYISIAAAILMLSGIWRIITLNINPDSNPSAKIDSGLRSDSFIAENGIDWNKIQKSELENTADFYLDEIDNETFLSLSQAEPKDSLNQKTDESVYDYFVDYDSGMEYLDYATENQPKN